MAAVSFNMLSGNMSASMTSATVYMNDGKFAAIHCAFSSSNALSGTLDVQGSALSGAWVSMQTYNLAGVHNSDGILVDISQTSVPYLQVVYTNLGASGSLLVNGSRKPI